MGNTAGGVVEIVDPESNQVVRVPVGDVHSGNTLDEPLPSVPTLTLHTEDGRAVSLRRQVIVGRGEDCDLRLEDPYVSHHHCVIVPIGNRVVASVCDRARSRIVVGGTLGARVEQLDLLPGVLFIIGNSRLRVGVAGQNASRMGTGMFFGRTPAMLDLLKMVHLFALSDSKILIQGESGTGKEMLAREIHNLSSRRNKPFVPINCGAIPNNLCESELFGHERGAFTHAIRQQRGAFRNAEGGTLFLDEIGELPLETQVKLLRALEGTFCPVGGEEQKANVRIIAATHRNLRRAVGSRLFREDLYYRLAVVRLHLPPVRERREDLLPIAQRFIEEFARERAPRQLSPAAVAALMRHPFPGNFRELRNALEFAVAVSGGVIEASHLRLEATEADGSETEDVSLEALQRGAVERAIERAGGNINAAADALGVPRTTLRRRIAKWALAASKK